MPKIISRTEPGAGAVSTGVPILGKPGRVDTLGVRLAVPKWLPTAAFEQAGRALTVEGDL